MPVKWSWRALISLQWRHNGCDGVSNHQPHDCLLNRLFRCRSKKTSKLRVTGLCAGNSPVTGEIPAQMAANAETVSIWWRHHVDMACLQKKTRKHDLLPFEHFLFKCSCVKIMFIQNMYLSLKCQWVNPILVVQLQRRYWPMIMWLVNEMNQMNRE